MDPLRHLTRAQLANLARQLRRRATPAERHAWTLLRHRRVLGLKFRRQHVLHGFIVDFYCVSERLVLELEGAPHDGPVQAAYDVARAQWLRAAGYRVVRVRNRDVTRGGIEAILRCALRSVRLRPPSPEGGGGQGVGTDRRGEKQLGEKQLGEKQLGEKQLETERVADSVNGG